MSVYELALPERTRQQVEMHNVLQRYQLQHVLGSPHNDTLPSFKLSGFTLVHTLPPTVLRIDISCESEKGHDEWILLLTNDAASLLLGYWLGGANISELPKNLVAAACDLLLETLVGAEPGLDTLVVSKVAMSRSFDISQQAFRASIEIDSQNLDVYCVGKASSLDNFLKKHGQKASFDSGVLLPMTYRVGQTALSLSEANQLRVGDVVLLSRAYISQQSCAVTVLNHPLWLAKFEDNTLTIIQSWDRSMTEHDEQTVAPSEAMSTADTQESHEQALDALPITINFELPGENMTIGDIQTLTKGHTFILGEAADSKVSVVVNGKVCGSGQLVNVEGRLGVQLGEWG